MFDHLQPHTVLGSGLLRVFTCVSLIDIGQFDVLTGNFLYPFSQRLDLRAVLFVGLRNVQGQ